MAVAVVDPKYQVLDGSGDPINAAQIIVTEVGTSDSKTTYSDPDLQTANTLNANNGVETDSRGEANIYYSGKAKIVVKDSIANGGSTISTHTSVQVNPDNTVQWIEEKTASFTSGSSFTITGDVTTEYHPRRRIKLIGSAFGTLYAIITNSTYSDPSTTVTVKLDTHSTSSPDATLTTVYVGVLSGNETTSIPPTPIDVLNQKLELFDDFMGASVDSRWNKYSGSDAQALDPDIASSAGSSNVILTAGDDVAVSMAVNGSQLCYAPNWITGNSSAFIYETSFSINNITSVCAFVGMTDATQLEMPFELGASNALTSNATNAVGFLFDTNADDDNIWLVGVSDGTDATHEDSGVAPVNGSQKIFRMTINSDDEATFYIDGTKVGSVMTNSSNGATVPTLAIFSRSAASRTLLADYVYVFDTKL